MESVYFAPFNTSGIWQVDASGGSPREVTRLDRTQGEVSHRWPQASPDGKVLFFTVWTGPGWDEKHLEAQIVGSGERRLLVRGASTGRYVSQRTPPLRPKRGTVRRPLRPGPAARDRPARHACGPVSEYTGAGEGAQFTVSDHGTLAYVPSDSRTSDRRMVWVDAGGSVQPLNSPPGRTRIRRSRRTAVLWRSAFRDPRRLFGSTTSPVRRSRPCHRPEAVNRQPGPPTVIALFIAERGTAIETCSGEAPMAVMTKNG